MHLPRPLTPSPGTLLSAQELNQIFGFNSGYQIRRACEKGKILHIAHDVYMAPGAALTRETALAFLAQSGFKFHIGGKTALIWRGIVPATPGEKPLTLWRKGSIGMPTWFTERFPTVCTIRYPFKKSFPVDFGLEPLERLPDGPLVSVPERALIEMLDEEISEDGFTVDELGSFMEMMRALCPEVMETVLQHCSRLRLIRICIAWAEKFNFPWLGAALAASAKTVCLHPADVKLVAQDGSVEKVKPRDASFLIRQTNVMARIFFERMGLRVREGYRFDRAEEPQEVLCWNLACDAQKLLTSVDVQQLTKEYWSFATRKMAAEARATSARKQEQPA